MGGALFASLYWTRSSWWQFIGRVKIGLFGREKSRCNGAKCRTTKVFIAVGYLCPTGNTSLFPIRVSPACRFILDRLYENFMRAPRAWTREWIFESHLSAIRARVGGTNRFLAYKTTGVAGGLFRARRYPCRGKSVLLFSNWTFRRYCGTTGNAILSFRNFTAL